VVLEAGDNWAPLALVDGKLLIRGQKSCKTLRVAQCTLHMRHRNFGRLGWPVSEVGYGMWGMGGWTGSDDAESLASLDRAIALGCNFFDTAFAYGDGHSEKLSRRPCAASRAAALRRHQGPAEGPPLAGAVDDGAQDVFPYDHVVA
jgi:hypothetical protein